MHGLSQLKIFQIFESLFLRTFPQTPYGQNLAKFGSTSGKLAQRFPASWAANLSSNPCPALSNLPSFFLLYSPSHQTWLETENKVALSPSGSPSNPFGSPYPDAPASFMGSPQLETTPSNPTLPFSLPDTTVLRRPRPRPVPPLWPIKGHHPCLKRSTPSPATSQTSSSPF
jgi:hypothetical protein